MEESDNGNYSLFEADQVQQELYKINAIFNQAEWRES